MSTKQEWLKSSYKDAAGAAGPLLDRLRHGDRSALHARGCERRLRRASSAIPASIPTRAACTARCIAGGCGRCASSPASASPRTPTQRFHFLLKQGQDGLSTAFDMPTLMGYDADHERARGEVGREGVAVSLDRRHGDAVRWHPARQGHHLDDGELLGVGAARDVPGGGRAQRRAVGAASAAPSRTTCSRSSSRRRNGSRRPRRRCESSPT